MARQYLINPHSFTKDKHASASTSTIQYGEIAVNCNSESPKLYIKTATGATAIGSDIKWESFSPDSVLDTKFIKKLDTPIGKGDAEHSAVLKGEYEGYVNNAISPQTVSVGGGANAGLKGYYYSKVSIKNKQIALSTTQPTVITNTDSTLASDGSVNCGYQVGDRVSIQFGDTFSFCNTIASIDGNVLTMEEDLPITSDKFLPLINTSTVTSGVGSLTNPFEFIICSVMANVDETTYELTVRNWNVGLVDVPGSAALAEGINTYAIAMGAHAEGLQTAAIGQFAHAEGYNTITIGHHSHSEGHRTEAWSEDSHAEGYQTRTEGRAAHAEGKDTRAVGIYSHAEGKDSVSNGEQSHAEGFNTRANENQSHAEGYQTTANGNASHTEGRETTTESSYAHAEGYSTTASGQQSHAEGYATIASKNNSHAEGKETQANGNAAHSEGYGTIAEGAQSHAEGLKTTALGPSAHAEGEENIAGADCSHVEGYLNEATESAVGAHVEGRENYTDVMYTHVEGKGNKATVKYSHVEGIGRTVNGIGAHVEGIEGLYESILSTSKPEGKTYKVKEGFSSIGIGDIIYAVDGEEKTDEITVTKIYSDSIGLSKSLGGSSHSVVFIKVVSERVCNGIGAHVSGIGTFTKNDGEAAFGKYNISHDDTIFSVGVGDVNSGRENAIEVQSTTTKEMVEGAVENFEAYVTRTTTTITGDLIVEKGDYVGFDIDTGEKYYGGNIKSYGDIIINEGKLDVTAPSDGDGGFLSLAIHAKGKGVFEGFNRSISFENGSINADGSIAAKVSIAAPLIKCNDIHLYESTEDDTENIISLKEVLDNKADESEVLKTTPQTLTDDEKSQVKENLGISTPILKSIGVGSAIQTKEVESFVNEHPDSPTSGQEIPTEASGDYSVVLNGKSNASAKRALAHGNRTIAQGENSHTEGHCTQTLYIDEVTNGYAAHAEGYGSVAGGTYSHAEGNRCGTGAPNSHAEGYLCATQFGAESAHAEGYETSAEAAASHTEGNKTKTSRAYSHAEGRQTETIGEASHTEGNETMTEGDYAHAEGWMTRAKGAYSHSEGQYTFTYADAAHSEGNNTHAHAPFSHAEGLGTKTNPDIIGQHVEGYYNSESDGVKVIGCGTGDEDRKNAVEVKQDGRVFVKGLGNYDGTNSNDASDLAHVVDNKANSGDVYNKTEMDNRIKADLVQKVEVATINGQSLINGGNIVIEGGDNIFVAEYGVTSYDEVMSAYNSGKICICKHNNNIYYGYDTDYASIKFTFTCIEHYARHASNGNGTIAISYIHVSKILSETKWEIVHKSVENTDNKTNTINVDSTDIQYPSAKAVYNALTDKADKSELTELSEKIENITAADLGLSSALKYCGITTTKLTDGDTTNPIVIDGKDHIAAQGCVVFYEDSGNTKEFVFNGTKWELLGSDLTYKVVQNAVSSPNANGNAVSFIDTISQDANGVITATKKNVDMPIVKGDAENSAVFNGKVEYAGVSYENNAISQTSMALGGNNIAGLKGYYFTYIDFNTKQIWLHDKQITSKALGIVGGWKQNNPTDANKCKYSTGDSIVIIADNRYYGELVDGSYEDGTTIAPQYYDIKITHVDGNVITVDRLPFTEDDIPTGVLTINHYDKCSLFCPTKQSVGPIDFGGLTIAEGLNTKAMEGASHSEGYNTYAVGKYSHAEGRNNISYYIAHAEGDENLALGDYSHAEGRYNKSYAVGSHTEGRENNVYSNFGHAEGKLNVVAGWSSHAEGGDNIVYGSTSHVEGRYNQSMGESSHAEGSTTQALGNYSHSEGRDTVAKGIESHAEGSATNAIGATSHAEGYNTIAYGENSHAEGEGTITGLDRNDSEWIYEKGGKNAHSEGFETKAIGCYSHAEGYQSISEGCGSHAEGGVCINPDSQEEFVCKGGKAIGHGSHAEGFETISEGNASHAEGYASHAEGYASHAEGYASHAEGNASHAEGNASHAEGDYSHAEGFETISEGYASHAEGYQSEANGFGSHAEGGYNYKDNDTGELIYVKGGSATGMASHAEGVKTIASGKHSHAEGSETQAIGNDSHAEGNKTEAHKYAHAEGYMTHATGEASHSEGSTTIASGPSSHAEGYTTTASGNISHAEGSNTIASGATSHAEGYLTKAIGDSSHAQNYKTQAIGIESHAEGSNTIASGATSHAEGYLTKAIGENSHTEGEGTITYNTNEHASGQYNDSTKSDDASQATHFSIGIGTSEDNRKNAFEVKWNGDVYITGIGGFTGANSDSSKSVQEVINELVNKLNEITTND